MQENLAHRFQAIQKQLADTNQNYSEAQSRLRTEEEKTSKHFRLTISELAEYKKKIEEDISIYQAAKQRMVDSLKKLGREYASMLEQVYIAKYQEKQKWYKDRIGHYDSLLENLDYLIEKHANADKALNEFKPVFDRERKKYDVVAKNFEQKQEQRDRLSKEAISLEDKLNEKYPWYGKHIRIQLSKSQGTRTVYFDNSKAGGFTRLMLKVYEMFHSIPEKKKLLCASQAVGKVLDELDRVTLEFSEVNEVYKSMLDKQTKLLGEARKMDDVMEAFLNTNTELNEPDFMTKDEAFRAKYGYLEQPCNRELILKEVDSLTLEERKMQWDALSKKIPECPEFFLKQYWPQGDVYRDADAIGKFDTDIQKAIEQGQVDFDERINEKQEKLTTLSKKRTQIMQQAESQAEAIKTQVAATEKEYASRVDSLSREILRIAQSDPQLYPLFPQGELSPEVSQHYVEDIAAAAQNRVLMPALPVGGTRRIDTQHGAFVFPQHTEWQVSGKTRYNFVIDYDKNQEQTAVATMNNLLMNMVLAFPVKKLKFTFVDLNISNAASLFTVQLDSQLYHGNPVVKEQDLRKQLEELQDRMVAVSKQCNNLLEYNAKNNTILFPYEVVVVLDYPSNLSPQTINQLRPLFQNGYKGGLFFVVMRPNSAPDKQPLPSSMQELNLSEYFQSVPLHEPLTVDLNRKNNCPLCVPIAQHEQLLPECLAYINRQAQEKEKLRVVTQSMEEVYRAPLRDASDEFRVPVGDQNGRPTYFDLNQVNHFHAFVMGKSGAGKSVFLHNIITNAILTYSPESLQLYLLDFKSGGVEFNRYRDVKHVKALLVDDSDFHITLEILRDLHGSMRERAKKLREAGVNSLQDYNREHPEAKLARIVLVVDECHQLFADRSRSQNEINAIVTKIAKEGRNQGVHLLFATQTLANANIPSDILNNLSDYFLMMCAATDAEKLVRESSKLTEMLYTGGVLYCHADQRNMFQAYFSNTEQRKESIAQALEKSIAFSDGNRFFFNGRQLFSLDQQVVQAIKQKTLRYPVAMAGRSVDIRQTDLSISMPPSMSSNILVFGINTQQQATRVSLGLFISLMISAKKLEKSYDFVVMNCLNTEDAATYETLGLLESHGCRVVEGSDCGRLLGSLAEGVRNHQAPQTIVLLLGQEQMRELRLETEIPISAAAQSETPMGLPGEPTGLGGVGNMGLGGLGRSRIEKRTYKSELRYLLENGPEQNIHFVLQIDKPGNLLFEGVLSQQAYLSMFRNIVMLKSTSESAMKLRLSEEIKLDVLSEDNDCLRAYYYNDADGSYTLFTPYALPSKKELDNLLK